jgi:hypothetical protein
LIEPANDAFDAPAFLGHVAWSGHEETEHPLSQG